MPNYTENYELIKPLATDLYDIEVPNQNMEKIDKALADKATLDSDSKVKAEQTCSTVKIINQTAHTLTADDMGKMLLVKTSSGTITITIPIDADMAIFPLGAEIEVNKWYSGATVKIVTEGADSSVLSMRLPSTSSTTSISIATSYGVVALKRIADSKWLAVGDVE